VETNVNEHYIHVVKVVVLLLAVGNNTGLRHNNKNAYRSCIHVSSTISVNLITVAPTYVSTMNALYLLKIH